MNIDTLIRAIWADKPPFGINSAANHMMHNHSLPVPRDLTPAQLRLWNTTHMYMCAAAGELLGVVDGYKLNKETWRSLMRGGVCLRILSAPGESEHIRMINAMRGERRRHGEKKATPLWEQLAYPAGHALATLALLEALEATRPRECKALGLDSYYEVLHVVLPDLRRTTKRSQEPRTPNCEVNCGC